MIPPWHCLEYRTVRVEVHAIPFEGVVISTWLEEFYVFFLLALTVRSILLIDQTIFLVLLLHFSLVPS